MSSMLVADAAVSMVVCVFVVVIFVVIVVAVVVVVIVVVVALVVVVTLMHCNAILWKAVCCCNSRAYSFLCDSFSSVSATATVHSNVGHNVHIQ